MNSGFQVVFFRNCQLMFMTLEPVLLENQVFSGGRKERFSQISKKDTLVSLESPHVSRVSQGMYSLGLSVFISSLFCTDGYTNLVDNKRENHRLSGLKQ